MDRGIANTLEKLAKALAAIAGDIAQLKLDIAKLDARVAAIDIQVAGIHRRLDASPPQESDEGRGRDLDLEREVFGAFKAPRKLSTEKSKGQSQSVRKTPGHKRKPAKQSARRARSYSGEGRR
jgi:hypothetical protein